MFNQDLAPGEPHPSAHDALLWIKKQSIHDLYQWNEAFASLAIDGNRTGQICSETLDRLLTGKPVSDRYLLGLAWTMSQKS